MLPTQKIWAQVRSDACRPFTKLRIGTASAGGTHSLARRTTMNPSKVSSVLRHGVAQGYKREKITSGNSYRESTWSYILLQISNQSDDVLRLPRPNLIAYNQKLWRCAYIYAGEQYVVKYASNPSSSLVLLNNSCCRLIP